MKSLLFFTLLLPALAATAETGEDTVTDDSFHVLVNPQVYDPHAFQGKGVSVGKLPPPGNHPGSLPSRERREQIFQRVPGLSAAVAKMDELDRDLLYMRAKNKPLKALKKLYPKLKEKQLAQLQKELARK